MLKAEMNNEIKDIIKKKTYTKQMFVIFSFHNKLSIPLAGRGAYRVVRC
jgi:hypothetical protein